MLFQAEDYSGQKEKDYELVNKQLKALIEDEPDITANLANASALLYQFLDDVNWVGFYLYKNGELVLAPFQGLPACVRIKYGNGVCGTALKEKQTIRVENVNEFPGHIACDAASQSEIVTPIYQDGQIIGVLDIDSPNLSRFDEIDQENLEAFAKILSEHL
ncbi:GAF domain-containing protein [Salinibacillus kushneri]|uniref:GAF domain-containing protein n=1 Tax=Salinibacillus kushneri TaxID=237682 RepID=A0A1I0H9Q0_9BACI|nr:GAF domain-containing protein [Salinibacillus kushneri]